MAKQKIVQEYYTGERALFQAEDLEIYDTVFDDGESPLKESRNITVRNSLFRWKYPFWYAENVDIESCTFFEMARAGIWYTKKLRMKDVIVEAPKMFRRCTGLDIEHVSFPDAKETFWNCCDIKLKNIEAKGDYFAMNSSDMEISGLSLVGNYSFDGVKNVTVRDSRLISKDAFWNAENVTIYDSFITGEYIGWNSKNVTLINCTVESLQGFCYMDNVVLKNCRTINTTRSFEYSTVDAEVINRIDSVVNPAGGIIRAAEIAELDMSDPKIDKTKTKIVITGEKAE